MMVHWLDMAGGAALGAIAGILATWRISPRVKQWSEQKALHREYHALAGRYLNYRLTEDGSMAPTGEIIELTWEPKQSLIEASAFATDRFTVWHSYIHMSLRFRGTGTGHYNIVDSIHGGVQQLVYSRQARTFTVMETGNNRKPAVHCWKLQESSKAS